MKHRFLVAVLLLWAVAFAPACSPHRDQQAFQSITRAFAGQKKILIPVPRYGFDPTESAVPFRYLKAAGHTVVFATPDGRPARADNSMVTGEKLGLWKSVLEADKQSKAAYAEMEGSNEFQHPIKYNETNGSAFDAILLPGGHDKGMREYLESPQLQNVVAEFFDSNRPVAAICHGTLLAARSVSKKTGKSVLFGKQTTGLTIRQEKTAYYLTKWYLDDYYLTYPQIALEDDVKSHLEKTADFHEGPEWFIPMDRDSPDNVKPGFTVKDGNYLSARWPGDANKFAGEFLRLLAGHD